MGKLHSVWTDFWVPPRSMFGRIPGGRRLRDRYHEDLADESVAGFNGLFLAGQVASRLGKESLWDLIVRRNRRFQEAVIQSWEAEKDSEGESVVFSYSYAADELFRYAKARGWRTVLGQIDPGPEEERIVREELEKQGRYQSSWEPAPEGYWERWRRETELADRIVVNSEWSKECLLKEGIAAEKLSVIPLVYGDGDLSPPRKAAPNDRSLRVLFLGQVNLRKGIARLLAAMEQLQDEAVELTLVGPSELPGEAWAHLKNVNYRGAVPRSEVGALYRDADIFILPTLSDGYALTQLEALANGLPVIASRHCGDVVREGVNGWILPDLKPETIARVLLAAKASLPLKVECPEFGMKELGAALGNLFEGMN